MIGVDQPIIFINPDATFLSGGGLFGELLVRVERLTMSTKIFFEISSCAHP